MVKWIFCAIFLLLSVASADKTLGDGDDERECLDKWYKVINQGCYRVMPGGPRSWQEAVDTCREEGAMLVQVETEEEWKGVLLVARVQGSKAGFWLGLTSSPYYMWRNDGRVLKKEYWNEALWAGPEPTRRCVAMEKRGGRYLWITTPCVPEEPSQKQYKTRVMCEREFLGQPKRARL